SDRLRDFAGAGGEKHRREKPPSTFRLPEAAPGCARVWLPQRGWRPCHSVRRHRGPEVRRLDREREPLRARDRAPLPLPPTTRAPGPAEPPRMRRVRTPAAGAVRALSNGDWTRWLARRDRVRARRVARGTGTVPYEARLSSDGCDRSRPMAKKW